MSRINRGRQRTTEIYYSKIWISSLIFRDDKHQKTRLLQFIDGDSYANYVEEMNINKADPITLKKEEIEWRGADYTMDPVNPMVGNWKVAFPDDQAAAEQFRNCFNRYIDANTGQNQHLITDPVDDQDKVVSDSSTKPFNFTFGLGENDKPITNEWGWNTSNDDTSNNNNDDTKVTK